MQAVIELQGHQYMVGKGERFVTERLELDEGKSFEPERVLSVLDGKQSKVGNPVVEGAKVTLKVIKHAKGDKIDILKYKNKLNYHIRQGHRQLLTEVEVVSLSA